MSCPDTATLFQCRSDPDKSLMRIRVAGRAAVFFRNRHACQGCLGRLHARLSASEPALIRGQGQPDSACTIVEISLGGAKLAGPPPGWAKDGEVGVLLLEGGALQVP